MTTGFAYKPEHDFINHPMKTVMVPDLPPGSPHVKEFGASPDEKECWHAKTNYGPARVDFHPAHDAFLARVVIHAPLPGVQGKVYQYSLSRAAAEEWLLDHTAPPYDKPFDALQFMARHALDLMLDELYKLAFSQEGEMGLKTKTNTSNNQNGNNLHSVNTAGYVEPAPEVKVDAGKAVTTVVHNPDEPNETSTETVEQVGPLKAIVNPCNVGFRAGRSFSLAKYEGIKIEVSLHIPCAHDEIDAVYGFAKDWVDGKLGAVAEEVAQAKAALGSGEMH